MKQEIITKQADHYLSKTTCYNCIFIFQKQKLNIQIIILSKNKNKETIQIKFLDKSIFAISILIYRLRHLEMPGFF